MKALLKLFLLLSLNFSLSAQSNFYPEVLKGGPRTGNCGDYYLFTINDTINNQFLVKAYEQFSFHTLYDTIIGLNKPNHIATLYYNGRVDFYYTDINAFSLRSNNLYSVNSFDTTLFFNNNIASVFFSNSFLDLTYFHIVTFDSTNKIYYLYKDSLANNFGNNFLFYPIDSFSVSTKKIEKINNIGTSLGDPFFFTSKLNKTVIAGRDSANNVELFYLQIPLYSNDTTVKISETVLFEEAVNIIHYASINDSILYFLSSDAGEVFAHSFHLIDSTFSIDTIGSFPVPINITGNDKNEIYLFYPMLDSVGNTLDSTKMITVNVNNWAIADSAIIPLIIDTATFVYPDIVFHHHDSAKQYLSTFNFVSNTLNTFYETTALGYIQYSINPWCIVSVDDSEIKTYKLFPNPTTSFLQLQAENIIANENFEWQIIDLSGKVVSTYEKDATGLLQINIEHLNPGLYISKFNINGKPFYDRIIKN